MKSHTCRSPVDCRDSPNLQERKKSFFNSLFALAENNFQAESVLTSTLSLSRVFRPGNIKQKWNKRKCYPREFREDEKIINKKNFVARKFSSENLLSQHLRSLNFIISSFRRHRAVISTRIITHRRVNINLGHQHQPVGGGSRLQGRLPSRLTILIFMQDA